MEPDSIQVEDRDNDRPDSFANVMDEASTEVGKLKFIRKKLTKLSTGSFSFFFSPFFSPPSNFSFVC